MTRNDLAAEEITLPVKRTDGETLEERLTGTAYSNILPARYLRRNADGELVEEPEDLFERVAKNIALAEAAFEADRQDIEITVTPAQLKPDHPRREELAGEVFSPGTTPADDAETTLTPENVNKFTYDTVVPELPKEARRRVEAVREEFQAQMELLSFVPNSPTLMNAGDELQQLSACFVDSPGDDLTDIHETATEAAQVFQSGGGMGYAFWKLRPYGDAVGSTGGIASGPITFMRTFDQMCETIAQGGTRRGAQMGVMRVSHPDVIEFIHAKNKDVSLAHCLRLNDPDDYTYTSFNEALEEARELIDEEGRVPKHLRNAVEGHLSNFNISVGVTDDFMDALYAEEEFVFTNPRTEEPHVATEETEEMYDRYDLGHHVEVGEVLSIPAEAIWEHVVSGAHENGEPGVIYLERVNKEHSFDVDEHPDHEILATNPCVTGDTLISTDSGLVSAEKLYEQGVAQGVVVDGRLSQDRIKEASSVYETGEKNVYKLTTEEGYELRLTADHRVMTSDGWTEAGNLDAGDTVHIQNRKGSFGQHGSAAEGRVFGWLVGDGHLKHGEERAVLNFYDDDNEICEAFAGDVNEIVRSPVGNANYDVGVSDISRNDDYRGPQALERRIRSTRLYEMARKQGLTEEKLQVPDMVMRGNEEMARGFLRALFTADGGVQGTMGKGNSVRLTSTSTELLKQVQRLLLNFGVASTVYENRRDAGTKELPDGNGGTKAYETKAQHDLAIAKDNLVRFREEIGFLLDSKNETLDERLDSYHRGPYSERFEATVESVEMDGHETVYDLTEPDTQSFVANGLVVHNCGEQPLEEYEACNLGHINLSTLAATEAPDWRVWQAEHGAEYDSRSAAIEAFLEAAIDTEEFDQRIAWATRFLENVVTMSDFPVPEIEQKVREMRKIGLGIMGLAQLYIQLGVRYGSEEGNEIARQLMTHINHGSKRTSHALAEERGSFEDWSDSKYADPLEYREWFEAQTGESAEEWADGYPIRNHNTTTIAPTGTTSMVGNTTGGCEPIYNVAYYKNVSDDVQGEEMLVEFDDYFLRVLEANDVDVGAVKEEAKAQMGSNEFDGVEGLETVPDAIGELFVITAGLSGKDHASVQCACQKGVDSAISKCIEEGTLVQTDQGLVPIEGFSENDEPGTFSDVDGDYTIDGYDVTAHYYAGKKPSTRIRLDSGAELVGATESHRVLTPNGWELLADLTEDDIVLGDFSVSHSDGSRPVEWDDDLRTSSNAIETPERMSPEFAEFLGMIAADGGAYEETGRVEISTDNMPVEDRYAQLCEELFDTRVNVEYDDRTENVRRVYLTSRNLARCVHSLVGRGAYGKYVPEQVIRGDDEEKLAFVRGLTLDGHNSSNGFTVYGGMARDLAYETAQLLRSFGVPKVYEGRKWVSEAESYEHLVTVSNELQDLVSAIEPHKNPEPQFVRYKVPVDSSELSLADYETGTSTYYAVRSARNRGNQYLFSETAEKIGVEHSGIAYKVTEVEDVGERELYDIEVEDAHRYLVNGMVSHNTCNFPNTATKEDMEEVYRYIYDNGGKGVTVYRDGTRSKQVLTTRAENAEFADEQEAASVLVGRIEEVFGGIEGFLDSEEVRAHLETEIASVVADDSASATGGEPPQPAASASESSSEPGVASNYAEKQRRPDVLRGVTQRIETGYGKVYVTINEDAEHEQPFELFANTGMSGGFTGSFTEALAKSISVALRSGVDPREVANKLSGIRSPKVAWDKGEQINSIPDAIGVAMRRYLDDEIDRPYPKQQNLSEVGGEESGRASEVSEPETDGGAAAIDAGTEETGVAGNGAEKRAGSGADSGTMDLINSGESPECPECGALSVYYSEGCKTCEACGWSEC